MTVAANTMAIRGLKNQKDMLLWYMLKFGPITPLEAMKDLGVMRLAARIKDLKDEGHKIATITVTRSNRWGQETKVAQYRLEK